MNLTADDLELADDLEHLGAVKASEALRNAGSQMAVEPLKIEFLVRAENFELVDRP